MRGSSSDGMNRGVHPAMVCMEGSLRTISTEFFSVPRDNVALQILRAVLTCAQGGAAIVARVGSSGNRNLAGLFFPTQGGLRWPAWAHQIWSHGRRGGLHGEETRLICISRCAGCTRPIALSEPRLKRLSSLPNKPGCTREV